MSTSISKRVSYEDSIDELKQKFSAISHQYMVVDRLEPLLVEVAREFILCDTTRHDDRLLANKDYRQEITDLLVDCLRDICNYYQYVHHTELFMLEAADWNLSALVEKLKEGMKPEVCAKMACYSIGRYLSL